jgi:thymidylate kinase
MFNTATDSPFTPAAAIVNRTQAELVDAAGERRLMVIGGLPPTGRDLDLLVPDGELPQLEAALEAAGFESCDGSWVRLVSGRAEAVDVVPLTSWRLPGEMQDRLLNDACPVAPYRRLVRPAPADDLLVLARRGLGIHDALADKHRRRIARALDADDGAWATAGARARSWGVRRALRVLRRAYVAGTAPRRLRALAAAEAARRDGAGWRGATVACVRVLVPARDRGAVIALSGVDGSGKSALAAALAQVLLDLGHDAAIEWSRITYDPVLRAIGAGPKRLLRLLERGGRAERYRTAVARPLDDDPLRPGDAASAALRRRVPAVNLAWTTIVALAHASSQRRTLHAHLREGRTVVRDRYVLDATVQLAEIYGDEHGGGLPAKLVRRLCPTPVATYWLDVDPDEAYRRKPEQYTVAQLAAHRRRYLVAHEQLGAQRIDASRPTDALLADLVQDLRRRLP